MSTVRKTSVGVTLLLIANLTTLHAQSDLTTQLSSDRTSLKRVFEDSIRLLAMQHSLRIGLQEKTRRELGGSFFSDYKRSVHMPHQWGDGDSGLTNYGGHPGQGAASGFIWVQRDPSAPPAFVANRAYLSSRLRGMAFAAGYSLQFEIGPFSEASIGNVGLHPETAGWVDHIMTPIGGLAIMVGEDTLRREGHRAAHRLARRARDVAHAAKPRARHRQRRRRAGTVVPRRSSAAPNHSLSAVCRCGSSVSHNGPETRPSPGRWA
jgi:hypothetical protein